MKNDLKNLIDDKALEILYSKEIDIHDLLITGEITIEEIIDRFKSALYGEY